MNVLKIIKNTIKKYNLIQSGDKIIVALSGGADSCCLLHTLARLAEELNISVYAAHVNHMIRKEAVSDRDFAEQFCKMLNIPFFEKTVDVRKFAETNNLSDEEAGRQVRYSFFKELSDKLGNAKIATAHNRNDCAETILMNFMRGSGLSGLCGIPYSRNSNTVIRPILNLSRQQIEQYCIDNNINFVTDKTNFEEIYTRNKIRLTLIPYIEENFNPAFIERITSNSDILSDENDFINISAQKVYNNIVTEYDDSIAICIPPFNGEHIAVRRRIISRALKKLYKTEYNLSFNYISDIINLTDISLTGKSINLPKNKIAKTEYDKLILSSDTPCNALTKSKLCMGDNTLSFGTISISICESAEKSTRNTIYIPLSISENLYIRSRKDGDYFYPVGMHGKKKKVKDFFIDLKIPVSQRDIIPIISYGTDEIVWIVGYRADNRFIADIGSKALKIEISN